MSYLKNETPNHELQRNFFASLEIPNLGRSVRKKNDL